MSDHLRGASFLKYRREDTGVRHRLHVSLFASHALSFPFRQAIKGFRQIRGTQILGGTSVVGPTGSARTTGVTLAATATASTPRENGNGVGVLVTRRRQGRFARRVGQLGWSNEVGPMVAVGWDRAVWLEDVDVDCFASHWKTRRRSPRHVCGLVTGEHDVPGCQRFARRPRRPGSARRRPWLEQ